MSAMKQNSFQLTMATRRFLGVAFALLGLIAWPALAANPLYENDAVVTDPAPIPDATNFVNTGTYNVTFPLGAIYQTHDTLNYTNTGFMDSVFGFYFDNFSTATSMNGPASSFDNENTINALSQIIVWATNIVNPGFMFVQNNAGLMVFSGNSVDLSSAALNLQGGLSAGGVNPEANDFGVGTDTNGEWNPGFALTQASATSSIFTTAGNPFFNQILTLAQTNMNSYFQVDPIGTNALIIRAVFIQDDIPAPQITHNVYFGPSSIGSGLLTVEWLGIYTNEIDGQTVTNYLYLNDEPAPISSNGVNRVTVNANTGIPNNYTFQGSSVQVPNGIPAAESFLPLFPFATLTNNYSYVNAQFISTSIATNLLVNTNVSAIGGRIQVYATNEMNLNNIDIQGENYLSLTSTNQFDGNNGAAISAAFTDLNLAVTNGYGNLTVSNLLQPTVPVWNGNVQAWSTRWTVVLTNLVGTNQVTITNDFRVELVEDAILPRSPAQVQNLTLSAGTNGVVLSDALSIYGNILINAQSLTLTTNGLGNGAASEEGELNVQNNDNVFLPTSLPNLHWLTNNGVINLGNLAVLGNNAPVYTTNVIQGTNAAGILSKLGGANVQAKSTLTIGTNKYAFVSKITNSVANQIKIGTTFNGTLSNLIAAINATAGSGVVYSTSTFHNTNVTASVLNTTNGSFTLKATFPGAAGNLIATTTTATNLSWHGFVTLTGGVDAVTNITNTVPGIYGALVNHGIISDQGSQIYANYFESSGLINSGEGSFTLNANTAIFTNAEVLTISGFSPFLFFTANFTTNIFAQFGGFNGNETITADTLVISNSIMAAGGGFIFNVTNLLTDTGVTNNNFLFSDGGSLIGLNLAKKPVAGDLLGTTIEMMTPAPNKAVKNVWSGVDYGVSVNGYTNNEAIGQLILDIPTANGSLNFSGTGASNGMYVDRLILEDYASYTNGLGTEQIPTLTFNTNLVIYYADAVASGEDVSYQLDNSNHGHLRWVPQYMGFFSSSNVVYMNGTVNRVNAGLVQSPYLDSNGNGIPNAEDPNPLFVASELNFQATRTNGMEELVWDSIPSATNYILYINCPAGSSKMPDLSVAANWQVLTQFVSPSAVPPVGGWPITNAVFEPLLTKSNQFYRIEVSPNLGQ
jgi:hypothetical protein